MTKVNKRLNYLDMSKGFAILLVVLGHIYERGSTAEVWIYSFHMPLFFIISGVLLKHNNIVQKNLKDIVIKRFNSIIIPYIMFELVAIVIYLSVNNMLTIESLRWSIIDCIFVYYCRAGATWFLPCLFVTELLFIIISRYIKNDKIIIGVSLILYIASFIIKTDNHFVSISLKSLNALGFLALGFYLYDYITSKQLNNTNLLILLILGFTLSQLNGRVALNELKFGNYYIYTICSIIGSLFVIFTFKKINDNKLLISLGKNSLIIMATHLIIQRYFIDIITGINRYDYIYGTLIFLIAMAIQVPIIYIINNYMPWMLGKFKKKEKLIVISD